MDGTSEFSSGSKPKIDLNEIFGRETLTALELLSIPDIVSEVKSNSETFSTFLKARPDLVQQLIDVTLRPQMVESTNGTIPVTYPFMSMQTLCFQTEEFVDFMLNTNKTAPEIQPEEPLQSKKPTVGVEGSLVKYLFQFLKTESRINETAAGYLHKLLNQIQYQRGTELFQFFESHVEIFQLLLFHCYSKCISDIFTRLLSIDNEQLSPKKLTILNRLVSSLAKQPREVELAEKLDNLSNIFLDIFEKCPDRYEGARYILLFSQAITEENCKILTTILLQKAQNDDILAAGLDILGRFLAFYKADKAKKDRKVGNPQNSEGSSMIAEQIQEPSVINNEALNIFQKFACTLLDAFQKQQQNKVPHASEEKIISPEKNKPEESKQEVAHINGIVVEQKQPDIKQKIHFSQIELLILVQDLLIIEPKGSTFEEDLLTAPFIQFVIKLITNHPSNNIMHNTLKNILVKAAKSKESTVVKICSKQAGLIQFILESSKTKVEDSYKNQLYHIATAIEQKRLKDKELSEQIAANYPTWKEFIEGPYIQRRKAYNRLLGDQDPKKKSEICMFSFSSRPAKPNSGIRVEVQEVKPYNFNGRGELGQENQIDEDLGLEIDSDDDKPARPTKAANSKRGMGALDALMTKEVKSEDEDTVRIQEDFGMPVKMDIEEEPGLDVEKSADSKEIEESGSLPKAVTTPHEEQVKEEIPKVEEESSDK